MITYVKVEEIEKILVNFENELADMRKNEPTMHHRRLASIKLEAIIELHGRINKLIALR